uniref:Uncharacterized protein n=1 Tax=Rhodopseudomonas palustris (strain BisA53) TaxID=316055 RepID=Q07J99_RHOP5
MTKRKGRDPLRDHKKKQQMGVLPTVFMGKRLTTVRGKDACVRLENEAQTDGFTATLESGYPKCKLIAWYRSHGYAPRPDFPAELEKRVV